MQKADTKEKAREEGIAIAREMQAGVRDLVQGVQVSAPFGRYDTAIQVIETGDVRPASGTRAPRQETRT
jgi:homocysteine S-methyltransferase